MHRRCLFHFRNQGASQYKTHDIVVRLASTRIKMFETTNRRKWLLGAYINNHVIDADTRFITVWLLSYHGIRPCATQSPAIRVYFLDVCKSKCGMRRSVHQHRIILWSILDISASWLPVSKYQGEPWWPSILWFCGYSMHKSHSQSV